MSNTRVLGAHEAGQPTVIIHRATIAMFRIVIALGFLLVLCICVHAQQSTTANTDGTTPSGLAPGSPAGSYALSGFENVNLFNGNLDFRLPLLSIGGRGAAGYSMTLALNLKSWHVSHFHKVLPDGNELNNFKPVQTGWSPYSGYGAGRLSGRHDGLQTSSIASGAQYYSKTLARLTFSTADGTEYELRDAGTDGQPLSSTYTQGAYRGYVFVTADGTSATYISDVAIYDNPAFNSLFPRAFSAAELTGYLMLKDGTRYRINGGNVDWIGDRNGNKTTFSYDANGRLITIIDSLNRQVTITYDIQDSSQYGLRDEITFNGFGGVQRVLRVSKTNLENALRPGSGYTTKFLGGTTGLFPELNSASATTLYNPQVTSAVWLPDGVRSYKLFYNSYGELSRVELPTGGAIEYDMTAGSGVVCGGPCSPDSEPEIYRRVTERRLYPNGSTGSSFEQKTAYTNSESIGVSTSTITVEQTDQTGAILSRSRHVFDGSALDSLFVGVSSPYGKWYEGHEKQTELLDTTGAIGTATVLRRVINTWAQRTSVSWWPGYAATMGLPLAGEPPKDPRLIDIVTTIEPASANLVTRQTSINPQDPNSIGFDQYNNQTESWEYDFGNGTPGSFKRLTHTDFVSASGYVGANVDPAQGAHLRGLPLHQWVSASIDGSNKESFTTYEYDNYLDDSRHKPLLPRTTITGHDSAYGVSLTNRGNLTGTTSYANAASQTGAVNSSQQYDIAGNIVSILDAREKTATIGFGDSFCNGTSCSGTFAANGYGFPTTMTSPIPDPTGQYGSTSAFVKHVTYDFWTGHVYSSTDANGQVSGFRYDDSLDRPTQEIRAQGTAAENQTTIQYDDANHTITSTSDLRTNNDNIIKGQTKYDGLGRTTESRTYENSTDYIAVLQVPFAVEQDPDTLAWVVATKSSNPFRPNVESPVWTTVFSDPFGRTINVKTPDGAMVRTSYSGNSITITDQAGKKRRTVTDGLGRLTRVDEPDTNGNLDVNGVPFQSTSYGYDALDDLIAVNQGSQIRTFVYDSLKRLISATNPESGTVCYGTIAAGQCQANGYDPNGNLKYKTDARSITTTYNYDDLNRNISIDYSDTTISPDVTRVYDNAAFGANGKGRLWISYSGGTETVGTSVNQTTVDSYDVLGKPLFQSQRFKTDGSWGSAYQTGRTYDLAGHVKTQTYPSLHTITYNYDNVGRLADQDDQNLAFRGNLGEGGAPRTYSRGLAYSAMGGLSQEQFGTDTAIYNKLAYNSRGQLAEIKESTSPNDSSWNRGKFVNWYSLSCGGAACNNADNNGNLRKQETLIPNNEQNTSWSSWYQQYEYDSLNRLTEDHEHASNNSLLWHQSFAYDRYGNRTIAANGTSDGINKLNFEVETGTNRLLAIGDSALTGPNLQLRKMRYDNAGNLTNDSWSSYGSSSPGAVTRTYDAENRMTSALDNSGGISSYTYNGDGQRVRRKSGTVETWQIYGMDGELLAEYAANAAGTNPQKEYGYRNGQLLIAAEPGAGSVAPVFSDDFNDNLLDANKWTVIYPGNPPTVTEQAQQFQITLAPNTAGYNGVDSLQTYDLTGRMVQVEVTQAVSQAGWAENFLSLDLDANNSLLIDVGSTSLILRSRVNGVNDQAVLTYSPTTHRHWRIRHDQTANSINFETSTDGSVWTTRKTVTPGFALTSLRLRMGAGAWGTGNGSPGAAKYDNFKMLASSQASSSLTVSNFSFETPSVGANGFQYSPTGGSWTFAGGAGVTGNNSGFTGGVVAPEGGQAAFLQGGNSSIISQSVSGFQSGTNYIMTFASTQRTNCCNAGGQDFQVYLDDSFLGTFHPSTAGYVDYSTPTFTTTAGAHVVKFVGLNLLGGDHTAFIDNVRIQGSPVSGFGTEWMVTDQLGTARMVFDITGTLANMKRHDYLPFGEELTASQGLRTALPGNTQFGYGAADGVRQKFTSKERDNETGLDYFSARYFSSTQGRFTSVDPSRRSITADNPQTWNRYMYALNNPLAYVDENGKWPTEIHNLIIERAFRGLSDAQRQKIKDGSWSVDDPLLGGQNMSHSNQHGQTIPGQSQEEAAEAADNFINTNVDKAKEYNEGGNFMLSLCFFGKAFHTVSDMTSPAHEGYQVWQKRGVSLHMDTEKAISSFRMGLAVGATMALYKYTYGERAMWEAVLYTPGGQNDPTVMDIHNQFSMPGSDHLGEDEALYDYRQGLKEGLNFDWGRQRGRRGRRQSERPISATDR